MLKVLSLVVGVSLGVAIFVAGKWYLYVTAGSNPHDEKGTSINAAMPDALNRWGCGQLHLRFSQAVAPVGCQAADGSSWK